MSGVLVHPKEVSSFASQPPRADSDLADLKRELRTRRYPVTLVVGCAVAALFLVGFVTGAVVLSIEASRASSFEELQNPMGKAAILSIGAVISILSFPFIHSHTSQQELSEGNRARRDKQRSLKRSLRVGRDINLPVLTKEQVEAGMRLDALISHVAGGAGVLVGWSHKEIDEIRILLFADLSREEPIRSIIEDRNARSATQVVEILRGMEAAGKPLQDGWL